MRLSREIHRFGVELTSFSCAAWHSVSAPLLGDRCRYYPTCSQYAAEAVREHGFFRGGLLAARRLCRCNSLYPGGYEPVRKKVTET